MRTALKWLLQDWTLKLAGIGIALLLWAVVKSEDIVTTTLARVPVQAIIRDPAWELATKPAPSLVSVDVTGPVREILHLFVNRPQLVVPVEEVADSVQVLVLRSGWVQFPEDVVRTRVEDLRPATVRLVFDPVAARDVRVYLPVRGRLPEGLVLGDVLLDPGSVRISGSRRRVQHLDSVPLPTLDLSHLTDTTVIRMDIDTAALRLQVIPSSVRVRVAVGHAGAAPLLPVADTTRQDTLRGVPADSARRDTLHGAAAPARPPVPAGGASPTQPHAGTPAAAPAAAAPEPR